MPYLELNSHYHSTEGAEAQSLPFPPGPVWDLYTAE